MHVHVWSLWQIYMYLYVQGNGRPLQPVKIPNFAQSTPNFFSAKNNDIGKLWDNNCHACMLAMWPALMVVTWQIQYAMYIPSITTSAFSIRGKLRWPFLDLRLHVKTVQQLWACTINSAVSTSVSWSCQ